MSWFRKKQCECNKNHGLDNSIDHVKFILSVESMSEKDKAEHIVDAMRSNLTLANIFNSIIERQVTYHDDANKFGYSVLMEIQNIRNVYSRSRGQR